MTRILVVDDEPAILRTLRINLRARGYEVETVTGGRDALATMQDAPADLVILDLGLPDLDGVEVLRRLRRESDVPVVVLSARHGSDDKVEALDEGADDYVTKPFGADELMARVRAALRRGSAGRHTGLAPVEAAGVRLDFDAAQATRDGRPVRLTPTEWRLLAALARRPGALVSHADLLEAVWGPGYGRELHYLRVYANQIRRKLETDPSAPQLLVTDPGLGYRLVCGSSPGPVG
ncbi:response regulator transcription factor [Arsenicicoccus dermatophilus]|uniref:response regulator transcription factor n=1 Tax=Arsenicicoccus dermatophilus TaxID=1076331 RepID=UPI003892650D